MITETRFNDCFQACKTHAQTAVKLKSIAHDQWIYGFQTLVGIFVVAQDYATVAELAAALVVRQVEYEARQIYVKQASFAQTQNGGLIQ
jgi:hypothetical protein